MALKDPRPGMSRIYHNADSHSFLFPVRWAAADAKQPTRPSRQSFRFGSKPLPRHDWLNGRNVLIPDSCLSIALRLWSDPASLAGCGHERTQRADRRRSSAYFTLTMPRSRGPSHRHRGEFVHAGWIGCLPVNESMYYGDRRLPPHRSRLPRKPRVPAAQLRAIPRMPPSRLLRPCRHVRRPAL